MSESTAIMTVNQETIMPALTVELAISRYKQINSFISQVLRTGIDFGKVPGTDKDTLFKPGAEKLCMFFGYHPTFQNVTVIEDWTGKDYNGEPFFYYLTRCRLVKNGEIMAEGDGSCNSRESRYRYRQSERVCPTCGKPAIKRSKFPPKNKPNDTPGWYCYDKAGGCGANFAYNDRSITEQQTGRIPNPDIADQANTILKMAQKRAMIAATLIGVNASDYFTQDVEDLPGYGDVVEGNYTVVAQPQTGVPQEPAQHIVVTDAADAGDALAQTEAEAEPTCPKCGGPMWDNRQKIADTGKKLPLWSCKAGKWNAETKQKEGCDGVIWPPKDGNGAKPAANIAVKPVVVKQEAPPRDLSDEPMLTADDEWNRMESASEKVMITTAQKRDLGIIAKQFYGPTEADLQPFRIWLKEQYGVTSRTELTARQAAEAHDRLKKMVDAERVPA